MNVSVDSLKFEKIHKTEIKNTAELLQQNFFLKTANQPSNFIFQKEHRSTNRQQILFYVVFFLFIMFAILKVVFNNYFNNIIKVFFNTTLRQSQLTEQLLLAKLPSLFYNVFFVVVISIYVFVLMKSFSLSLMNNRMILLYILFSVLCVYAVKYFVLQISGWLTGYKQDIDNYIFIVFLINKILAILLLPIITLIAFSDSGVSMFALKLSFVMIFGMILLRYLRSFSLLNRKLSFSKFHFLLYIIGVELIPILLIYKTLLNIVNKNL